MGAVATTVSVHAASDEDGDRGLVAEARGDPAAFGAIYDRCVDRVFGYCLNRLGDWQDAEDVTSTIFISALTALPRYRDESFRAWLFTIAHHAVANHHRARRPSAPLDAASMTTVAPGESPEAIALIHEERRRLIGALSWLPPDQRRVIELRLAGLTGPEIATVLRRSHGAVKMLQLRAFDRLRQILQTTAEEPDDERR